MRTMYGNDDVDEGALGIATIDLLLERDFLVKTSQELKIPFPPYSPPHFSENNPTYWADKIRDAFNLDLSFQYKCPSARQFYLYLRAQIESQGIFIHCFTDVSVETVHGIAIYDEETRIIGINADDRPPAKSFSIIYESVHIFKRESAVCNDRYSPFSYYLRFQSLPRHGFAAIAGWHIICRNSKIVGVSFQSPAGAPQWCGG